MEELVTVWGNHIKFNHMYREGLYKDLAEYFTKIETKEENGKGKSKYHRSRNLKEPETRIAVMVGTTKNNVFSCISKKYKGWKKIVIDEEEDE